MSDVSPRPDLSAASDQELVALARQGREEAYREIVQRYKRAVLQLISGMVGHRELAKDLAQDTFVNAFEAIDSYRPELKFSTWLLRIAKHAAIDYLRCKELTPVPLDDPPDVTPPSGEIQATAIQLADPIESTPAPTEQARALGPAFEQAIGRLNHKYRQLVILRFVEELSYEHIAEILDLPVGTVATQIHRARKQLKTMLGPVLDSPPPDSIPTPA